MRSSILPVALVLASGCGGSSGGRLDGAAAKGPFVRGSSVSVATVNSSGSPSGEVFLTDTDDDAGRFTVDLSAGGPVRLEASGFYYNEATGALSTAPITLRAYTSLDGDGVAYVNLFTHLANERIESTIAGGEDLSDAVLAAESQVRAGLHIGHSGLAVGPAIATSLLAGDDDASAYLFAVSTVLARVAIDRAGPDGAVDATLTELVNTIASDFADGSLDGDAGVTGDDLFVAQSNIDADAVMGALQARFDEIGVTTAVPNLHRVFDMDADGTADVDDTDADGDGFTSVSSGGDDCDDYREEVRPGGVEVWYDGVDGDCDGASDHDQDKDGSDVDVDCDDLDATRHPAASEVWYDGVDQDCNGGSDYDADIDGFDAEFDCDDVDETAFPGADEVWYDGVDQACDGGSDYDADADGHDSDQHLGDDCDDADVTAHPGQLALCGLTDNDCDGETVSCNAHITDFSGAWVLGPTSTEGPVYLGHGDLDADGTDDLVVSALGATKLGTVGYFEGPISSAPADLTQPPVRITGDGFLLFQAVGDFDGDGDDDLVAYDNVGGTPLYDGPLLADRKGDAYDVSYQGTNAARPANAGDWDGDGADDLSFEGQAALRATSVFLQLDVGSDSGVVDLDTSALIVLGAPVVEVFSTDVGRAGSDLDGDGYDDFVFGVALSNEAYVIAGRSSMTTGTIDASTQSTATLTGEAIDDGGGSLVVPARDADGDGTDGVFVVAPGAGMGVAYYLEGPVTGTTSLALYPDRIVADVANGMSAGGVVGDVDDDGHDDFLFGLPGHYGLFVAPPVGAVGLGDARNRVFAPGEWVGPVGDLDSDGRAEVVFSAYPSFYVFAGSWL